MAYTQEDVIIYEINVARARIGKMSLDAISNNNKELLDMFQKADKHLINAIESIKKGMEK